MRRTLALTVLMFCEACELDGFAALSVESIALPVGKSSQVWVYRACPGGKSGGCALGGDVTTAEVEGVDPPGIVTVVPVGPIAEDGSRSFEVTGRVVGDATVRIRAAVARDKPETLTLGVRVRVPDDVRLDLLCQFDNGGLEPNAFVVGAGARHHARLIVRGEGELLEDVPPLDVLRFEPVGLATVTPLSRDGFFPPPPELFLWETGPAGSGTLTIQYANMPSYNITVVDTSLITGFTVDVGYPVPAGDIARVTFDVESQARPCEWQAPIRGVATTPSVCAFSLFDPVTAAESESDTWNGTDGLPAIVRTKVPGACNMEFTLMRAGVTPLNVAASVTVVQ